MPQFLRTRLLLGKDKFNKLQKAKVTIIGLGAVGSCVTEALARAGVGTLRLADCDKIKISNLNRQLIALHSTIGLPKAVAAKARVLDINPACAVESFETFVAQDTLDALIDNRPDFVVDAIDALNPKVQLLSYCHTRSIPVISSMGAALRTDPFSIRLGDIFETYGCPLASHIRSRLRKQGITGGIRCVYSSQKLAVKGCDAVESMDEGGFTRGRTRKVLGSMPTITAMFGFIIAHYVIDHLAGGLGTGENWSFRPSEWKDPRCCAAAKDKRKSATGKK